jgi:hypothetical protein
MRGIVQGGAGVGVVVFWRISLSYCFTLSSFAGWCRRTEFSEPCCRASELFYWASDFRGSGLLWCRLCGWLWWRLWF